MRKGTDHTDKLTRLRKIEGQVRGVHKMIDEGRYCVDILHAVSSAIGALKKVEGAILKDHLDTCVRKALNSNSAKEREAKLEEVKTLMERMRK